MVSWLFGRLSADGSFNISRYQTDIADASMKVVAGSECVHASAAAEMNSHCQYTP